MPTPKIKTSKSKKNMRRSHHKITAPGISLCSESGEVKRPHCVGPTGYYKGKLVIPKMSGKSDETGDLSASDFEG